jgi:glycosyltransferase involved in cell wall biosynthesis
LSNQPELERDRRHVEVLDALTDLLVWGDFFVCSSEKQRDYWLGWLNALDRINPLTYDDDPTFRRLIDIVAFGLPNTPPQHTRAVLKGVRPGIAATDRVIIWGGGVYNWFDPLTLIRAMKHVSAQRSDVKLFFLGIRHPNPNIGVSEMAERAIALSQELDLYEKCVFFNDWVSYDERQNYLLEADVGVSLHFAHLETHFSFRTRLLDYIWAGLPVIVTRGDVLSDLIEDHQLGWAVGYESVDDVTAAILESASVSRSEFGARFAAITPQLNWDVALQPLIEFCREPRCAPDKHRARNDWQSLAALKLISHINALRRDINTRDDRVEHNANVITALKRQMAAKDAEIERLQETIDQIRQGRVMRLLDRISRVVKRSSS